MTIAEKIGEKLREMRKAAELPQRAIADVAHVSVSTVSRWERGAQEIPIVDALLFCIICGREIDELIAAENEEDE